MEASRFLNNKIIRAAVLDWKRVKNWQEPYAVTLTLKKADKASDRFERLNAISASQNLKHFVNLLNRRAFGKVGVRKGRCLNCIAVLEDNNVRPHFHLCIEKPSHLTDEEFTALFYALWPKTRFGYREIDVKRCDDGWLNYMMKYRTKSDLSDAIDWMNFTNTDRAV